MNKSFVKNLHPFYGPSDDDIFDIDKLLFGDDSPEEADSGTSGVNYDNLSGSDLDSALESLLAADSAAEPAQAVKEEAEPEDIMAEFAFQEDVLPDVSPSEDTPEFVPEEDDISVDSMDIDALLASLGGGDDSISLSGTLPDSADLDTDDILNSLIAMDEKADSSFDIKKSYEDDEREQDSERKLREDARKASLEKPTFKKRIMAMSTASFLAASALILVFIIGSGFGVHLGIRQVHAARLEAYLATAHLTFIEQPHNVANYSHFVPLNEVGVLGDGYLLLTRMNFGQRGTFFHFDDVFDPEDYIIILHDQDDNLFSRIRLDISYEADRRGTVLQFSPLLNTTRELTLHIQERGSKETAVFNLTFREPPGFPRAVYVNHPIPLYSYEGQEAQAVIANAVFSNTGSEIVYMLHTDPVQGSATFNKDGLSLRDGGRHPAAFRPYAREFVFPEQNRVLGRIAFGPVRNLDSTARINFSDLFVFYPMPNRTVNIERLFRDTPEDEQIIPLLNHTVILERMGIQGPFVIIVFHGVDNYGSRVRTELDARLIIETAQGEVVIPGENFSIDIGTDLFFDTREHGITTINPMGLRLEIDSINVSMSEVSVPIHLDQQSPNPFSARVAAESDIKAAFSNRLAFRAGELPLSRIRGFSPEILNNQALMRHYTPLTVPDNVSGPMYDVRVVMGAFSDRDTFLAVVEEEWVTIEDGIISVINNTHQVAAKLIEDSWVIVSNRII